MNYKICTRCKIQKEAKITNFRWLRNIQQWYVYCRICEKERNIIYRAKNREYINKRHREYMSEYCKNSKNKEKVLEYQRDYREKNKKELSEKKKIYGQLKKDSIRNYKKQYNRKKRKDPCNKVRCNVSRLIHNALKKKNSNKRGISCFKYLKYTPQQLKHHLESQFESWMSWDNYGIYKLNGERKWNIDHIMPQSKLPYDSMDHPNFQKCWALENLRPFDAKENIKKGNK